MPKIVQTAGRDRLGSRLADNWFAHLAFEVEGEATSTEWCEPVSDEEYGA